MLLAELSSWEAAETSSGGLVCVFCDPAPAGGLVCVFCDPAPAEEGLTLACILNEVHVGP